MVPACLPATLPARRLQLTSPSTNHQGQCCCTPPPPLPQAAQKNILNLEHRILATLLECVCRGCARGECLYCTGIASPRWMDGWAESSMHAWTARTTKPTVFSITRCLCQNDGFAICLAVRLARGMRCEWDHIAHPVHLLDHSSWRICDIPIN